MRSSIPRVRVISLGAGVQSTTMALMATRGEIGPMPDCAIFADTQGEPRAVYDHLAWLMSPSILAFPVHVVTAGNLSEKMLGGDENGRIPFFIKNGGMKKRQCTRNYKLVPIRKKCRELLGVRPRGYVGPGWVEQWVGISTNEADRIKPSGFRYITRRDPLIEKMMSRADCERWLVKNNYPIPPKSSCNYCPYQSRAQWLDKKINHPEDFHDAVLVDRAIRQPNQISRFRGELFIHRDRVPLEEVDLTLRNKWGQMDLFGDECEGMCGV